MHLVPLFPLLTSTYAIYHFVPRPAQDLAITARAVLPHPTPDIPLHRRDDETTPNNAPHARRTALLDDLRVDVADIEDVHLDRQDDETSLNGNHPARRTAILDDLRVDVADIEDVHLNRQDDETSLNGNHPARRTALPDDSPGGAAAIENELSSYMTQTILPSDLSSVAGVLSSAGVTGLIIDSSVRATASPTGARDGDGDGRGGNNTSSGDGGDRNGGNRVEGVFVGAVALIMGVVGLGML